jgi:3-oxoacyl-[acyl-carrier protein] reductase
MDLGLSGRRVLVLGSTEGLGLAIATRFAEEGARVAVSGRRAGRVADVAAAARSQRHESEPGPVAQ